MELPSWPGKRRRCDLRANEYTAQIFAQGMRSLPKDSTVVTIAAGKQSGSKPRWLLARCGLAAVMTVRRALMSLGL